MQITSSPKYPQSNGLVERMVQTVKGLLNNSTDPYMALLSYRVTPLPWCKLSPAELLMGRKVRTDIPQAADQLKPTWPYLTTFRERDREYKLQQKKQYDQQHRMKDQEPLDIDVPVWVTSEHEPVPGRIQASSNHPRSYIVSTPTGPIRRNRQHLNQRTDGRDQLPPEPVSTAVPPSEFTEGHRMQTRLQTGMKSGHLIVCGSNELKRGM